jgi:hypothetical protein
MDVIVSGSRSSSHDWHISNQVPSSALPTLTPAEKEVAKKLGITEEGYARSTYAEKLTRTELELRARRLGNLIEMWLKPDFPEVKIESVWLKTFEGKFRIDLHVGRRSVMFFMDEELVDELFNGGSAGAEKKLRRVVDLALIGEQVVVPS